MTDDASTAYICIYCPFNSDNLEALENHLTNTHGHGCQDAPPPPSSLAQSSSSSNIINKAGKREAPDDEQSPSALNGIKRTKEHPFGVKRARRTVSPTAAPISTFVHSHDANGEHGDADNDDDDDAASDDEDDDDDERDSSSNAPNMSPQTILTCPTCGSTYHRLGHLVRHARRKHRIDLSNYDGPQTYDLLTSQATPRESSDMDLHLNDREPIHASNTAEIEPSQRPSETPVEGNTTTDCPYCDYKTTDIEQFKLHIIAHIRDKNYRCLLCNRLYKYRGDCSFHIRRKHHRYSANSNDYIQRFLFDTSEGDETMSTQSGGPGSALNGIGSGANTSREQDEPVRYFGCPYCDYTSNYGGDVRKHQARKHPNVESKVIKIIRQDSEHQGFPAASTHNHQSLPSNEHDAGDDDDDDNGSTITRPNINLLEPQERKEKIKTVKKTDVNVIQQHPSTLPNLPNFAPVRVFQCSSCHQQGTYKWVVERHIRAKHPDQPDAHVIELPAELAVKLQKISPPLKRFRCSLCPLQSKHTWVIIRHIKHFHTLQTASVLDIQPDGTPTNEETFAFPNGDFSGKSVNHDSDSSSASSSCNEAGLDAPTDSLRQHDHDEEDDESDNHRAAFDSGGNGAVAFLCKCSACDFTSNVSWHIQKHITDAHADQPNAHIITQYRSGPADQVAKLNSKKPKSKNGNLITTTVASVTKTPMSIPLSPNSALAKAKFSPAVEEALLSLQGSKINAGLYAVQPKFGIKRLKCRHCFYRSNWKTDMIRHVRIRHNLTEPDHNKDMIMMTEQEARSTIETYENTFGKELRRRTFRTWNDWAKAEEEFTPKDGSLQYTNTNGGAALIDPSKPKKCVPLPTSTNDESKRLSKPKLKHESKPPVSKSHFPLQSISNDEFKQLPNPSNIVSRLLLTTSPTHSADDDAPLDLSLKPSALIKPNHQATAAKPSARCNGDHPVLLQPTLDDDPDDDDADENTSNGSSTVQYACSACPYKRSKLELVQRHLSLHLTGQGVACPLCSYAAFTPNSLMRHMTIVHPTSQTIIKFAPVSRATNAHVVEQHQCPLCPYQCDRSDALSLHRRLEHEDEEFDIDSSSGIGGADDEVEDEDMDNDDGSSSLPVDPTVNMFQCPLCSPDSSASNFGNLEQFTVHVYTEHRTHMHNNQSCPFCSFIAHATSSHTLDEHMQLHFNGTLVLPDPSVGVENVKELLVE